MLAVNLLKHFTANLWHQACGAENIWTLRSPPPVLSSVTSFVSEVHCDDERKPSSKGQANDKHECHHGSSCLCMFWFHHAKMEKKNIKLVIKKQTSSTQQEYYGVLWLPLYILAKDSRIKHWDKCSSVEVQAWTFLQRSGNLRAQCKV